MQTTRPELQGSFGAVSSSHWLPSTVGMAMLERGGNAFDAVVAAGFTLQVVEPHQNGLGGDVPVVGYDARTGRRFVLCGQGPAPARATITAYHAAGLDAVPGTGLMAAVVPGAFDAWMQLLRDHGTMGVRDVLEPAIAYARNGYPVTKQLSKYIGGVAEVLATHWPDSAAVYLVGRAAPAPGSIQRNVKLADTYERILKEAESAKGGREAEIEAARNAYYRGFVAEGIGKFCEAERPDGTGGRQRGVLAAGDLAKYKATYEAPAEYTYHGITVAKTGAWGQGPAFLQTLALLEGFDVASLEPNGADFVHLLAECLKLTMVDRDAYYGDPDFTDVPLKALLSKEYNDARRKLIGKTASLELRPGAIGGKPGRLPEALFRAPDPTRRRTAGEGEPNRVHMGAESGDTVNVNVIDRHGNFVSAMPSGGWLQSSPVIPELGFCLGTRAQMFWLEEGLPSSLAPGKRPRTTLTPGLAFRDGKPFLAFGSPGGDGQDQWALQFFLHHVHHGMNLQQAIEAPAFVTDHPPSSFHPREAKPGHLAVEDRFGEATIEELRRRGHKVEVQDGWAIGRLQACSQEGGLIRAAANPRTGHAYAVAR